jgi:hypothetical protein
MLLVPSTYSSISISLRLCITTELLLFALSFWSGLRRFLYKMLEEFLGHRNIIIPSAHEALLSQEHLQVCQDTLLSLR